MGFVDEASGRPTVGGSGGLQIKRSGVGRIEAKIAASNVKEVSPAYVWAKRVFDITVAMVLIVVLSPLAALIAAAIALDSPGPIIFVQKRVKGFADGGHPILFRFYKFRSMFHGADTSVHRDYTRELISGNGRAAPRRVSGGGSHRPLYKLAADPRVTRFGHFLRRTSIDELPQLWNVLIGDMSLVGPRPPLPYEVAEYQPWHKQRLAVTPGMTGLWQVSGRSALSFDDMVRLDLEYAARRSFLYDLTLLLRTIPVVLLGAGAG